MECTCPHTPGPLTEPSDTFAAMRTDTVGRRSGKNFGSESTPAYPTDDHTQRNKTPQCLDFCITPHRITQDPPQETREGQGNNRRKNNGLDSTYQQRSNARKEEVPCSSRPCSSTHSALHHTTGTTTSKHAQGKSRETAERNRRDREEARRQASPPAKHAPGQDTEVLSSILRSAIPTFSASR